MVQPDFHLRIADSNRNLDLFVLAANRKCGSFCVAANHRSIIGFVHPHC